MGPEFESDSDDPKLPNDIVGGDNDLVDVGAQGEEFSIEFADDDVGANPFANLTAQNEPDLNEDQEDLSGSGVGDASDTRHHEDVQRERQLRLESEKRWLAGQEETEKRLLEAQKESVKAQKDSFRLALDGIDVRIRTAQDGLKYARTENDVSAEVDLQAQLDQLKDMRRNIEGNLSQIPNPEDLDKGFNEHIAKRRAELSQQTGGEVRGLNDKANAWIGQNGWFNDPRHQEAKKSVLEINQQLTRERMDPSSDEFFAELNRRLARLHPEVQVKSLGGSGAKKKSSAPPVASRRTTAPARSRGEGGTQRGGRQTVKFDASDRVIMKSLGIDAGDKAAVQRYAKEKFNRETRERANRQGR